MTESNTEKKEIKRKRWALYPYRLAHHPLCKEFEDHVYTINGKKVCRGCVNFYVGILLGIILAPIVVFVLKINYWMAFISTNILFIFTPLSVILNPPRIIKDICRLFLGMAMTSALLTIILSIVELFFGFKILPIVFGLLTIIIYIISKRYFTRLRMKKNESICRSCEQFYLPRCDGMAKQIDESEDSEKTDLSRQQ